MNLRSILLQIPAYVAFAAFIGYFSSAPVYHPIAPGNALVKLSFTHAGERKEACHERSEAELAKLAPNMRAKLDCPRERSPVIVAIDMDGAPLLRATGTPGGLRNDLPSTLYRRVEVPSGRHTFTARLADGASGEFKHQGRTDVELAPGRVLVIDFVAAGGGFRFRS